MIRRMGPLRCYSAKSLERSIGTYKKRIRSSLHPGINAGNIMETKEIFKFFNASGIFDFSALTAFPDSNEKNFEQHPQDATYPQLWSPFDDSFTKVGVLLQGSSDVLICGLYRTIPWCRALMGCMTRLTGMRQRVVLPFHQQQHLRISTSLFVPVKNWFVCKILFFFRFQFSANEPGSHYVYGELAKTHGVSPISKSIPRIQLFGDSEQKFVVFDTRDIVSSVGLLNSSDNSAYKYVIKTGDAFAKDMSSSAGKIGTLE
ncbi:uncharacterized protein EV154DRAFT_549714 [Mucor mucedo]|uniref:uncharacterized protein n=1 Tax=Mucor mucedo TaxID=29922 RepID=UPI0022203A09|nr:uncharacterized protein EV154DRAFT_549714 [Mucor mucedo]KAI7893582.1 hypothetical protein EV154DRAFT_549714 [Mucor mucedo]